MNMQEWTKAHLAQQFFTGVYSVSEKIKAVPLIAVLVLLLLIPAITFARNIRVRVKGETREAEKAS